MLNLLSGLFGGDVTADRTARVAPAPTVSKHRGHTKTPRAVRRRKNRALNRLQKASRKANR